jgi:hypothetical protein
MTSLDLADNFYYCESMQKVKVGKRRTDMSILRIMFTLILGGCVLALGVGITPLATPAMADDDESVIEDTYVAPLDLNTSDEDVHEQASSGFDTAGPVVVQPDYYDSTQPDSEDTTDSNSDDSGE